MLRMNHRGGIASRPFFGRSADAAATNGHTHDQGSRIQDVALLPPDNPTGSKLREATGQHQVAVLMSQCAADIVIDALTMAWFRRKPGARVLCHSDRSSQYASQAMTAKLAEYGTTASMSRKGDCWDDAPSESFFNSLKNEPGARRDLRDASRRYGRPVRVHRGVLQRESPPLHAGLQLANTVPRELDQQACCSAIHGGMGAARWKAKFDGHLRPPARQFRGSCCSGPVRAAADRACLRRS